MNREQSTAQAGTVETKGSARPEEDWARHRREERRRPIASKEDRAMEEKGAPLSHVRVVREAKQRLCSVLLALLLVECKLRGGGLLCADDVRVSGVSDGEGRHAEIFTASSAQINVVCTMIQKYRRQCHLVE